MTNYPSKLCPKCKQCKPASDFYKRLNRLTSWCKDCYRLRNRTRARRIYNQNWRKSNNYDNRGIGKVLRNAKQSILYVVRSGLAKKLPCEWVDSNNSPCGELKVQGHHCDYTKPLEVIWLCCEHHREWHKKYKPIYPEAIHSHIYGIEGEK